MESRDLCDYVHYVEEVPCVRVFELFGFCVLDPWLFFSNQSVFLRDSMKATVDLLLLLLLLL